MHLLPHSCNRIASNELPLNVMPEFLGRGFILGEYDVEILIYAAVL